MMLIFLLVYYFAYGSNLSHDFLLERLKEGEWVDDWHRAGVFAGEKPKDFGAYILDGYEFSYTLNAALVGDRGTAGNIACKRGGRVFGVLYDLTPKQMERLDLDEGVPFAYRKELVAVYPMCGSPFAASLKAWAYVGNAVALTDRIDPDPAYVELVVNAAKERKFPCSYIMRYLDWPVCRIK